MKGYFRLVRYILLAAFIVGALIDLVYIILNSSNLAKIGQSWMIALLIFLFILCLILGPSLGLLFLKVADLMDNQEAMDYQNTNNEEKVFKTNETSENSMTDSKQTNSIKKYENDNVCVSHGVIRFKNSSYNIKYISNINNEGEKVTFDFYSKKIEINCTTKEEAENLYKLLIEQSK